MKLTRRSFLKLTGAALIAPVIIRSLGEANAAIAEKLAPVPPQEVSAVREYLNPQFDINAIVCSLYKIHNSYSKNFNDAISRGRLRYHATEYLRDLQYNRAVYDFIVTCDESNNPIEVVSGNNLVLDVTLKASICYGEFKLRFSFDDSLEDPRDIISTPLKLEDVIYVTTDIEAGRQKVKAAPFVMVYVVDKSSTDEQCNLVHSVLCDFWRNRYEWALYDPRRSFEPVVGRSAAVTVAKLELIPLSVIRLTPARREEVHSENFNSIHWYSYTGSVVILGNYGWSNGTPLYGITVDSLTSRNISFASA